jgi:hypothetical protein
MPQSPHQPGCQQNEGRPHKKPKLGPETFKWEDTTFIVPRKLESTSTQDENIDTSHRPAEPSVTMNPRHEWIKQLASRYGSITKPHINK